MVNVNFNRLVTACLSGSVLLYLLIAAPTAAQEVPAAAGAAEQTGHADAGDPGAGKSLFEQNCSNCHGIDAGGRSN